MYHYKYGKFHTRLLEMIFDYIRFMNKAY